MGGNGNNDEPGESALRRSQRVGQNTSWGELLDSTGWGRPAAVEPRPRRAKPPPPPVVEVVEVVEVIEVVEEAASGDARDVGALDVGARLEPEENLPVAEIVFAAEVVKLPPVAALEPPQAKPGAEVRPPASNAGLFDDWAKGEGAGWAGVPRSTKGAPSPEAITAPAVRRRPAQDLEDSHAKVDAARNTLKRHTDEIAAAEATLGQRHAEIVEADNRLHIRQGELETARADLEALAARRDALICEAAALEDRVFHERGLLTGLEQEQAEVGTALAAAATMAAALRDEVTALAAELADRQARVAGFEVQLGSLIAQAATAEDRTFRDRQALDALAGERAKLERELEALKSDREQIGQAIALERETLARAAEAAAAAVGQRDEAASTRADLITDLKALEAEQTRRQRALTAAAAALETQRQALLTATRERDLVLEESRGLTRQLEALRAETAQAQVERTRAVQDFQERRLEFQTVYNRDMQILNKLQKELERRT